MLEKVSLVYLHISHNFKVINGLERCGKMLRGDVIDGETEMDC